MNTLKFEAILINYDTLADSCSAKNPNYFQGIMISSVINAAITLSKNTDNLRVTSIVCQFKAHVTMTQHGNLESTFDLNSL